MDSDDDFDNNPRESEFQRARKHFGKSHSRTAVINRREFFKFLPACFSNDLVFGTWWFVWGSIFTMLIPIYPFSYYLQRKASETQEIYVVNTSQYGLLIFIGIAFTVGSIILLRAVEDPPLPPLSNIYHFHTDELISMWLYLIGTLPIIPVSGLYLMYNPKILFYRLSFAGSILACLIMYLLLLACYPSDKKRDPHFSNLLKCLFQPCCGSFVNKHFGNDFLLAAHVMNLLCWICAIGSFALIYVATDALEYYDYVTSGVDWLFFAIGSLYFVLGTYPETAPPPSNPSFSHPSSELSPTSSLSKSSAPSVVSAIIRSPLQTPTPCIPSTSFSPDSLHTSLNSPLNTDHSSDPSPETDGSLPITFRMI